MAIDTQYKVMRGIQGHHGDNWDGLDDALATPTDYDEYVTSVDSKGSYTPASEAQLETGITTMDTADTDATSTSDTEVTDIRTLLGDWSLANLQKLKRVLKYIDDE